ncbi:hypothetical protein BDZ85DRAFT_316320 [Elsinoe ampelina]|uniref:Uncharacterized protein n=1 Tax=Elsinoe ampelina TaxID=302913 RepID=A0A6A6GMA3_9PEZI|nr:hypothetical protein BDZ85DRAFT_316320 [Elsinoe ampelina]
MSASALSLSQDQATAALQQLQDIQKGRQAPIKVKDYTSGVKASLINQSQYNWNDVLIAEPALVASLGLLIAASTSQDAQQVQVIPPESDFRYLTNWGPRPSLSLCLVQVADSATRCLLDAQRTTNELMARSEPFKSTVRDILVLLSDNEAATKMLIPTASKLIRVSDTCQETARKLESQFSNCLGMLCELHACCAQASTADAQMQAANQLQLAALQTQLPQDGGKSQMVTAAATYNASLSFLNKSLLSAVSAVASDWPSVLQELTGCLSKSSSTATEATIASLIEFATANTQSPANAQVFDGKSGSVQGGSIGSPGPISTSAASIVPPTTPNVLIADWRDPAYALSGSCAVIIGLALSVVFGGDDHSVAWSTLQAKVSGAPNGIGAVLSMLQGMRESFTPSTGAAGVMLQDVLAQTTQVLSEIASVVQSTQSSGTKLPSADDPQVKGWQQTLTKQYARVVQLDAAGKNASNAYNPPSMNVRDSPIDVFGLSGALKQQYLNSGTTQVAVKAAALGTSVTRQEKSMQSLTGVQKNISALMDTLARLPTTNMSFGDIRSLLIKTIEIFIVLKSKVNGLVGLYGSSSTMSKVMIESQIQPFISSLKSVDFSRGGDGQIVYLQRQIILNTCLSIQGFSEVYTDTMRVANEVNQRFLMQGLGMVNDFSSILGSREPSSAQNILQSKTGQLVAWANHAVRDIASMLNESQRNVGQTLDDAQRQATQDVGRVGVVPPVEVVGSVDQAANDAKSAAQRGFADFGVFIAMPLGSVDPYV